jgi:hypothetical protein
MYWHGRPGDADRRRRLHPYSGHEETPRHLTIELTADGTDYLAHGEGEDDDEFREHRPVPADKSTGATSQAAEEVGLAVEPAVLAGVSAVEGADEAAVPGAGGAARKETPGALAASALSAPAQESATAGCPPYTLAPIVHTEPDHAASAERRRSRRWPGQG